MHTAKMTAGVPGIAAPWSPSLIRHCVILSPGADNDEGTDLAAGGAAWGRCEALTAGLAGELAEQLRLILEPTVASRLAGDYRSGAWMRTLETRMQDQ